MTDPSLNSRFFFFWNHYLFFPLHIFSFSLISITTLVAVYDKIVANIAILFSNLCPETLVMDTFDYNGGLMLADSCQGEQSVARSRLRSVAPIVSDRSVCVSLCELVFPC